MENGSLINFLDRPTLYLPESSLGGIIGIGFHELVWCCSAAAPAQNQVAIPLM